MFKIDGSSFWSEFFKFAAFALPPGAVILEGISIGLEKHEEAKIKKQL